MVLERKYTLFIRANQALNAFLMLFTLLYACTTKEKTYLCTILAETDQMRTFRYRQIMVRMLCALMAMAAWTNASAQNADGEPLRRHSTLYGAGFANVLDTYLSPYSYKGFCTRTIRETERRTRLMQGNVSYQTMVDVGAQFTNSPANNAKFYSGGVRYSNAWLYNFSQPLFTPHLHVAVGPQLSAYVGGVYNDRNGNNPAQAKADAMLDVKMKAEYDFSVKSHKWIVSYQLSVPLMGIAFSPDYGQSYYEMYEQVSYAKGIVFANFVNMPSMRHLLTLDIPIGRNKLRVGWAGELMQSRFRGIRYHSYTHDFMIGFTKYFVKVKN